LREYVKMLRRIERAPAESPLTSGAIRSLERSRRNHAANLLADSRAKLNDPAAKLFQLDASQIASAESHDRETDADPRNRERLRSVVDNDETASSSQKAGTSRQKAIGSWQTPEEGKPTRRRAAPGRIPERKPISEVLRDIYDSKK